MSGDSKGPTGRRGGCETACVFDRLVHVRRLTLNFVLTRGPLVGHEVRRQTPLCCPTPTCQTILESQRGQTGPVCVLVPCTFHLQ